MSALRVLGIVARNRELRRVELAFAAFNGAEWAAWIAMLVYAYDQGGATTAGLVAVAQLVPAGLVAPIVAGRADRHRPGRVLALGYAAQAAAMGATAAALLLGWPPLLAYALAAISASAVTVTRPAQAALLPTVARTPDELTATNVVSGWIESVSVLVAPALAGVLLAVGGPGWVFATTAILAAAGGLLVAPIPGPPPAGETGAGPEPAWRLLSESPQTRVLVGLLGAQYVAIGALDVLYVVLAISVLDLGNAGAGYLNAAFGAGGVVGIALTAALVGRRRLAPALAGPILLWSAAFAVARREADRPDDIRAPGRRGRCPDGLRRRRANAPPAHGAASRPRTDLRRPRRSVDGRPRCRLAAHPGARGARRSPRRAARARPAAGARGARVARPDRRGRPRGDRPGHPVRRPARAAALLAAARSRSWSAWRGASSRWAPRPGRR